MNSYKIISTSNQEDTLYTTVESNINGTLVTVEIPHFRPQSKEEVLRGIENRLASEEAKLIAKNLCEIIKQELI